MEERYDCKFKFQIQKLKTESSKLKKQTLAIIGVGMMGGSLGLAVKKRRLPYHVIGIGRKKYRLAKAKKLGVCDEVTTNLADGVKKADLIIICTSVFAIVPTFKKILPHLKPEAIVNDIGSVKSPILNNVKKILHSHLISHISYPSFIGGHPMAGSEKTGVENACADLYQNATVALCPLNSASQSSSINKLRKFWNSVDAEVIIMKPEIHDWLVSQTSHLPHILAGSYAQLIGQLQSRNSNTSKLLSGSFQDLTRIVDSNPRQWAEISQMNRKFIINALESYMKHLNEILRQVKNPKKSLTAWERFYLTAKEKRRRLLSDKISL